MTRHLMLMWDYDTPAGFDVSANNRHLDPLSDYTATDRILGLLAAHGVVATFACVGLAAEPGPLPYHNPGQIRAIHAAGHEIASHAHRHELLPALTGEELLATCRDSKAALEDCIGAEVVGFVPPWNRPFHHPRRLALSLQDWRAGRWRQSIASLCVALNACGYTWVRVHYAPVWEQLARKMQPTRRRAVRTAAVGRQQGVTTLRLSYCGYDRPLLDWLAGRRARDELVIIYAHPHAIEYPNSQNWQHLKTFLDWTTTNKESCDLTFTTPKRWLRDYQPRGAAVPA